MLRWGCVDGVEHVGDTETEAYEAGTAAAAGEYGADLRRAMSNRRGRMLKRVVNAQLKKQYLGLFNSICDLPFRERVKAAWRIIWRMKIARK